MWQTDNLQQSEKLRRLKELTKESYKVVGGVQELRERHEQLVRPKRLDTQVSLIV
jgi:hypothetical protein